MDPEQNEREQVKALKARRRFLTVWTIVGAILLTGVLVYLFNLLSVPVGIVIWTVVIVFCLRGPVNKLEKLGVPRLAGTAIAYVLMFVVLALVGLLMFSPAFGVGDQFTNLIQSVPGYIQTIANWGNDLYARYADVLQNDTVQGWITDAFNALVAWASTFARDSASGVVAIGTGVVNTFVALGFALVVAFWMLMELPDLGRESERLVGPKHREDLEMLHVTFTRVMGGYIKGTLLQCAIIGVGCVVLFGVIGIPNYAALGGIAGLLNIIPIVGPWLGGALAAVVGVFVSPWIALVALLGTIAIQQIVYTFVSPKIMANSVDVHPALTLIALMAGSTIGGAMSGFTGSLVGMLASIPAVAVGVVIVVAVAAVIFGGVNSIARVCEWLVPIMAGAYALGCLVIMGMNAPVLGEAVGLILECAFTPKAAFGGAVGSGMVMALQFGCARGLFSNESGLGTAPIVAAAAKTKNPADQALISMTGAFWSTGVICLLTGLVLVSTMIVHPEIGADILANPSIFTGAALASAAFAEIPVFGTPVLVLGMCAFAYSTILGWSYYGNRCVAYLFGPKGIKPYQVIYVAVAFFGAIGVGDVVWTISDIGNALMAIPNIIVILLLSGMIARETKHYVYDGHLDEEYAEPVPRVDKAQL